MNYIHFFATAADIAPVLQRLDGCEPLKYVETGARAGVNRPIHLLSQDIPNIGISTHETGNFSKNYLVSPREIKNIMQYSDAKNRQRQWHLNNGANPDSVSLTLAGLWTTGTLLPGHMTTLHDTPTAQRIMANFTSAMRDEGFVGYDIFWLGREAIRLLEAGRRLVSAEQAPPRFDIPHPSQWTREGRDASHEPATIEARGGGSVGEGQDLIGGVIVDLSAVRYDGSVVRVMLVDTLADGVTPTAEALETAAFIRGARPHDELRLVPKRNDGPAHSTSVKTVFGRAVEWARGIAGKTPRH